MILALLAWTAAAHQPGLSAARLEPGEVILTFSRGELASRGLDPVSLLASARMEAAGRPCAMGAPTVTFVDQDGVELRAALTCPEGARAWTAGYLTLLDDGHRQTVEVAGEVLGVVDATSPTVWPDGERAGSTSVAVDFFGLGIEHIVTGYDHLAFLFGLLLVARSARDMALVVTGFTLAHSLTLTAAALGWASPAPAVVEPLIAASIVAVGLENLVDPPVRRRLALTFALGLVHGFGFAGVLREIGLPRDGAMLALLAFNMGVEAGQLAIVAPLLPLLLALRERPAWLRYGLPGASLGVAAAGSWWLLARLAGG